SPVVAVAMRNPTTGFPSVPPRRNAVPSSRNPDIGVAAPAPIALNPNEPLSGRGVIGFHVDGRRRDRGIHSGVSNGTTCGPESCRDQPYQNRAFHKMPPSSILPPLFHLHPNASSCVKFHACDLGAQVHGLQS